MKVLALHTLLKWCAAIQGHMIQEVFNLTTVCCVSATITNWVLFLAHTDCYCKLQFDPCLELQFDDKIFFKKPNLSKSLNSENAILREEN